MQACVRACARTLTLLCMYVVTLAEARAPCTKSLGRDTCSAHIKVNSAPNAAASAIVLTEFYASITPKGAFPTPCGYTPWKTRTLMWLSAKDQTQGVRMCAFI